MIQCLGWYCTFGDYKTNLKDSSIYMYFVG